MNKDNCKFCNKEFEYLGIDKTCDNCWEILIRIRNINESLLNTLLHEAKWEGEIRRKK